MFDGVLALTTEEARSGETLEASVNGPAVQQSADDCRLDTGGDLVFEKFDVCNDSRGVVMKIAVKAPPRKSFAEPEREQGCLVCSDGLVDPLLDSLLSSKKGVLLPRTEGTASQVTQGPVRRGSHRAECSIGLLKHKAVCVAVPCVP